LQALAELCERYWQPLYCYARRRGRSPEDAQDSVQGFLNHLIRSRGLATVDRTKGRFRNFLLASFRNFMMMEDRRKHAGKRDFAKLIQSDGEHPEARLASEPTDPITPEMLYDAEWARVLLCRATERLQQEQIAKGRGEAFRILKAFLGGDGVPIPYEEAACALGLDVPNITNFIHRLRQRHRQLVREEVGMTVLDPTDVDTELHGLCEALVQAGGRLRT
jgi:RNA polymerase sigma factor (sigma-70 family)